MLPILSTILKHDGRYLYLGPKDWEGIAESQMATTKLDCGNGFSCGIELRYSISPKRAKMHQPRRRKGLRVRENRVERCNSSLGFWTTRTPLVVGITSNTTGGWTLFL